MHETALINVVLFQKLYTENIIKPDAFTAWRDDVATASDRIQGKITACEQTGFIF
jgi:hypothetical protein